MTQFGPVEVVVVGFPGTKFSGAIAPALRDVVNRGDISIIDFAIVAKSAESVVTIVELEDMCDAANITLSEAVGDLLGLLDEDELVALADDLRPGSSAAAIVFEHTWARNLAGAISDADGEVLVDERIPGNVVLAAVEAVGA